MLKVLIIGLFLVSVASALSCAACTPEMTAACPLLTCHKSERVRGQCECCDKCGQDLGEMCTEADPCYPHLVCYALDKDVHLPWFYNGICVSNQTFHELPPEPTPCGPCEIPAPLPAAATTALPPPSSPTTAAFNEKKAISAFVSWVRRRLDNKQ